MSDDAQQNGERPRSRMRRFWDTLWRLIVTTVGSCMRYRVTGLAAEAAFFAILSVPPLIFAFAGAVGYVTDQFSAAELEQVRVAVVDLLSKALTESAINTIVEPTIDSVLRPGLRYDVISVGFVLALWSGSRALNVFVDTITIMHGLGGHRGIVKTRALSFVLYVLAMLTGAVSLPLVVAGPTLVGRWLPERVDFLMMFYWPTVIVVCICFLATLYHVSVPVRTNWSFNLPGATFTLVCWIVGSYVLRWVLTVTAAESKSVFGPLAAPIAVLLWLYIVALAVLIGAAVNAAFDTVFPQKSTMRARTELMQRLRQRIRSREGGDDADEEAEAVGTSSPPESPEAGSAAVKVPADDAGESPGAPGRSGASRSGSDEPAETPAPGRRTGQGTGGDATQPMATVVRRDRVD